MTGPANGPPTACRIKKPNDEAQQEDGPVPDALKENPFSLDIMWF